MASLYHHYHRSRSPSPCPSGSRSFVAGDDAHGLSHPVPPPPSAALFDELNELLGEALEDVHRPLSQPASFASLGSPKHPPDPALDDGAPSLPSSASDYSDGTRDGTEAGLAIDPPPCLAKDTPHPAPPPHHSSMSVSPPSVPSPSSPHDILTYPQRMSPGLLQATPASSPSPRQRQPGPFTPRSPVVRRDSSDLSFLDQWQWLDAQCPAGSSPQKVPVSEPSPGPLEPKPAGASHARERLVAALDAHFQVHGAEAARKRRLLVQRQQMGAPRIIAGRPTRVPGRWSEGVPCLSAQEVRRLKPGAERCRAYGAALSQLAGYKTGLDLWVWLKTRGLGESAGPLATLSAYMQVPSTSHPRDASHSSTATFPLRANAHKAIQIGPGGPGDLVELVDPLDGPQQQMRRRHRPSGMVVNALMEVKNLPFPGLYPHSAGPGKTAHPHPHSPLQAPMTPEPARRASQHHQEQPRAPAGRFFSTIGRRNSTKRNGGQGAPMISGPMMAAPPAGPRGPRPESTGVRRGPYGVNVAGEQGPRSGGGRSSAGSTPPGTVVGARVESGGEAKTQRRSFAYGSSAAGGRGGGRNGVEIGAEAQGTAGGVGKPMVIGSLASSVTCGGGGGGAGEVRVMKSPTRMATHPTSSSSRTSGSSKSNKWTEQVEKIMDILPFADREIVGKVVESVGGDEVAAIGAYLELESRK